VSDDRGPGADPVRVGGEGQRETMADETTALDLTDLDTASPALPFASPDTGFTRSAPAPARAGSAQVRPASSWEDEPRAHAATPRITLRSDPRGGRGRRRTRLAVSRVDPWSVFVLSLIVSLFLGVVLLVAVLVLYALLDGLGVLSSVNGLAQELEVVGEGESLLGLGRVLGLAAVLAAVDIVVITVLATLGAYLYNLCAALTGGIEVTLSERE